MLGKKAPAEVAEAERRWRQAEEAYRQLMRGHRPPALEGEVVPGKFLDADVMRRLEEMDRRAEARRAEYESACVRHGVVPHW
jgi:hypothetical protein